MIHLAFTVGREKSLVTSALLSVFRHEYCARRLADLCRE